MGGPRYNEEMHLAWPGLGRLGVILTFVSAALLEVAGDALIRKGMRGGALLLVGVGFAVLGTYGVVVNLLDIDFSRLLGAYVGVFAVASVVVGKIAFGDRVSLTTWIGLAVILGGSFIIHLGHAA